MPGRMQGNAPLNTMLLLPLPLSKERRAGRLEKMNQHASFLCEELLPCLTSILEAAPATLLLEGM